MYHLHIYTLLTIFAHTACCSEQLLRHVDLLLTICHSLCEIHLISLLDSLCYKQAFPHIFKGENNCLVNVLINNENILVIYWRNLLHPYSIIINYTLLCVISNQRSASLVMICFCVHLSL